MHGGVNRAVPAPVAVDAGTGVPFVSNAISGFCQATAKEAAKGLFFPCQRAGLAFSGWQPLPPLLNSLPIMLLQLGQPRPVVVLYALRARLGALAVHLAQPLPLVGPERRLIRNEAERFFILGCHTHIKFG